MNELYQELDRAYRIIDHQNLIIKRLSRFYRENYKPAKKADNICATQLANQEDWKHETKWDYD